MAFLSSINIIGSGLTAQQLRLDVVSENITNSTTTRTENDGGAYRRKMVVLEAQSGREDFRSVMARAAGKAVANRDNGANAGGVRVTQIVDDPSPLKLVYDPTHPDADENGYYYLPNVDVAEEEMDAMAATRSYEANLAVLNAVKSMAQTALSIGNN